MQVQVILRLQYGVAESVAFGRAKAAAVGGAVARILQVVASIGKTACSRSTNSTIEAVVSIRQDAVGEGSQAATIVLDITLALLCATTGTIVTIIVNRAVNQLEVTIDVQNSITTSITGIIVNKGVVKDGTVGNNNILEI